MFGETEKEFEMSLQGRTTRIQTGVTANCASWSGASIATRAAYEPKGHMPVGAIVLGTPSAAEFGLGVDSRPNRQNE